VQPVSIAIEADQSSFQFYSGGVMTAACGTNLDHGVLVRERASEEGGPARAGRLRGEAMGGLRGSSCRGVRSGSRVWLLSHSILWRDRCEPPAVSHGADGALHRAFRYRR